MRHTRGHTANRRSHHALKPARFETCKDCGAKHLMHRVCPGCGKYRGRLVVDVAKKALKLAKRAEAKKEAQNPGSSPKALPAKKKEPKNEEKSTEKPKKKTKEEKSEKPKKK